MTYSDGFAGLHGWQWMFIAEGLPTILLGVFTLYYLTDRPANASWLSQAQRDWLQSELRAETAEIERHGRARLIDSFRDVRVWLLATLFGCALVGIYGMFMWLPQIIKSMGALSDIQVGFLSAVPPLLGIVGTILISRSSDRTGDRKMHLAAVYVLGAIGMLASAYAPNPVWAYVCLCIAGLGLNSGNTLFWSLNASFMTGDRGGRLDRDRQHHRPVRRPDRSLADRPRQGLDRKLLAGAGDDLRFPAARRRHRRHHARHAETEIGA